MAEKVVNPGIRSTVRLVRAPSKGEIDTLKKEKEKGEIDFLREVYEANSEELSSCFLGRKESIGKLMIPNAVKNNHYRFLSEAVKNLPSDVVHELICQADKVEGSNPLHYAAMEGNIFTVKLLVNAYVTASTALGNQGTPPWLSKNSSGNTPLRSSFVKKPKKAHEHVAMYLVSTDHFLLRNLGEKGYPASIDQSSTMVLDKKGASVFFCAMREGFSLLAEQILSSGLPYSLSGIYDENPLHHASKCNEQVSRLLLEKHPELIGKQTVYGATVLDRAVEDNAAWLVKLMLLEEEGTSQHCPRPWNTACRRLIWHTNSNSFGDTPLHIAARKGNIDIAKLLVQGYESAIRDEAKALDVAEAYPSNDRRGVDPLNIENSQKDIPLFVALKKKHDDLGVYLLSVTIFNVASLRDEKGKNAYEIAVENGCEKSRISISDISVRISAEDFLSPSVKNILHPSVLKIVHHFASGDAEMSEMLRSESVRRLATEGLSMFTREPKKDANSHLKEAAERGADWLVKLLLEGDNTLINDSTPAWQIACTNGHLSTLFAFVEQCDQQEFIKLCQSNQQTPLHHIKLVKYEEYKKLLANPIMQELKNQLDSDGATPLHRAIKRNDIGLTKALLETEGIQLDIEDLNHKTALDLLEARCITHDNFFQLYKELLANPVMTQELKNRVDNNGATPLHRAIVQNARGLVKALMESKGIRLEIKDNNGTTALDLIEERSSSRSADVYWYELYKKLLAIPERLQKMKNRKGSSGATPLHIVIEQDDVVLAKTLVQVKGIKFNIENTQGKTALDMIEERCYQCDSSWHDLYKELLANTSMTYEMKNRVDMNGATPLHRAIEQNSQKLAKLLMEIKGVDYEIRNNDGKTAVDMIEERCKSKNRDIDGFWFERYKELLANPDMRQKLKNHKGSSGVTPLHIAIVWDDLKLTKKLLRTKGIELSIRNRDEKTALDLIEEQCDQNDSPWYELYKELLDNPNYVHELKNRRVGNDKETPLHRAIKWNDIRLAKTLLETQGVELDIVDKNGKTALDLLDMRCSGKRNRKSLIWVVEDSRDSRKEDSRKWGEMCREIRLDPSLKIFRFKYLQRRTSLKDMNNALSVVAALLATITFAAGFTVPGGLNSEDGTATLGTQPAFLVFSIANTVAMCTSMVVLFMLIGAMIWEAHPEATRLIDLCVFLLQLSLCGTIVAFMTGVYAIMAPKVKWVAIIVIILCSLAFVVALVVVIFFWPLLYKPSKMIKVGVCKLVKPILVTMHHFLQSPFFQQRLPHNIMNPVQLQKQSLTGRASDSLA